MKYSPQLKMDISKVVFITACYVLLNLFIAFFSIAMIHSPYSLGASELFEIKTHLGISVLVGLIAGVCGGAMLVLVNGKVFRRKSFRFAMLTTAAAYVLIFVVITGVVTSIYIWTELGDQLVFSDSLTFAITLVINPIIIVYFIMWGVITLLTLFLLQVNDKFGPGILLKFLMGQYHQPKKEQRIFMFADMRSSTTIAEKIGNEQYFQLLNDLFADITDTILNHEGEIYQYVGDEIAISWSMKKGIHKANCLHCFVQIQQKLIELGPSYKKKYGLIPELKAGLHYGQVMAGEVGVIKKDIIYSGDVLNTTSRIQEQCNQYQVDFLISRETFDLMPDAGAYELIPLGSIELRGKQTKIDLNTIRAKVSFE